PPKSNLTRPVEALLRLSKFQSHSVMPTAVGKYLKHQSVGGRHLQFNAPIGELGHSKMQYSA
ncbi:hypothetical protein, partial [Pseudomonas sp. IPO3778]|uniref:hypothetical protein n=1 Tax=Pseudomonas sp. IPO3778 TaxID=2726976 RepID=UPI001C4B8461